jgi:hypothetical protein
MNNRDENSNSTMLTIITSGSENYQSNPTKVQGKVNFPFIFEEKALEMLLIFNYKGKYKV